MKESKKKIAVLTTIFPMKMLYLKRFFNSLEAQTHKDFDVIVINDGFEELGYLKDEYNNLNIIEEISRSTPAKNREFGINLVIERGYDILVFADSDDYFGDNRIQVSIEKLRVFDIIVNDLSLFNEKGIFSKNYFSARIENNSTIDFDFIQDKNIFGLTNTALNVSILDKVVFDSETVAVDWYLFKRLLAKKLRAVFTSDTVSYYRQYEGNSTTLDTKKNLFWWEIFRK